MDIPEGQLVKLTDAESIARFGEGPFRVVKNLPHLHAVELDELGAVDLSHVALLGNDGEAVPVVEKQKEEERAMPDAVRRRIEAIAGHLVSHSDANVRGAMKEILRVIWEGEP